MSQIYRVTSRTNPDFAEWALTPNSVDPDCVHTPISDSDVADSTLTIVKFDTSQEATAFAAGIDLAQIEASTAVSGGTVLVDWLKSGDAGVTREDRRIRDPGPNTFTIETWWTVIHHTKGDLQAATPEAALAQAREMVRDGSWFFGDPQPVEGSEGATQITVWSEGMARELLADPENDDVHLEAEQAALQRLRREFPIVVRALRDIAHNRLRIDEALADDGDPPGADAYNDLFGATGIAGNALTAIGDAHAPS
jgi:hypothetical protein